MGWIAAIPFLESTFDTKVETVLVQTLWDTYKMAGKPWYCASQRCHNHFLLNRALSISSHHSRYVFFHCNAMSVWV